MRSFPAVLALALTAGTVLVACESDPSSTAASPAGGGAAVLDVSVGFYPYEFVTRRVGGPEVRVENLTPAGGEPHDLELTPRQVAELASADLVVYSRGFQPAVDEAVDQQAAGRALDVLSVVEPRQGEAGATDPHVWLDPMRTATIATAVAEELAERAPQHAAAFRARAQQLGGELQTLDGEMRQGLATCERREIVTSHDAFGYLAAAYGLRQVAVSGLSPEDEASPQRLAEVARFARRHQVTTIFFEELVSPKVAESLAQEVGARAAVLSPVEGPPETGDYLGAMRANLGALRTALTCS